MAMSKEQAVLVGGVKTRVVLACTVLVGMILLYVPMYTTRVRATNGLAYGILDTSADTGATQTTSSSKINVVGVKNETKPTNRTNIAAGNITTVDDDVEPTAGYVPTQLCTIGEYPMRFVLDTVGKDVQDGDVVLEACTPEILTIRAVGSNEQNVNCEPWVDMYGRILGPDLAQYPGPMKYSLYFNKVDVTYSSGGNFNVRLPSLEPGKYHLEIILAHGESERENVYNTLNPVPCLDSPVKNTPLSISMIDKGKCAKQPQTTPLCTSGVAPGRWVTAPRGGCDGKVCEGDINVLASSRRVWAPYDCHYKLYGPRDLKKCIKGKNVLIIGDSITEEITNEILQIYHYKPPSPPMTKTSMGKGKLWLGRPQHWSPPLYGNSRIGFSFVLARPLGCGITCVTEKTDEALREQLTPYGKADLLIALTGLHDACPRRKNKTYDVLGVYENKLAPFEVKLRKLLTEQGRIIWLNSPEASGGNRCNYLSKPRLRRMSDLTTDFLSTRKDISYVDYFNISGSCHCGNEHKGIRFYKSSDAAKGFNGFVSRMVAHIILNLYCN